MITQRFAELMDHHWVFQHRRKIANKNLYDSLLQDIVGDFA